MQKAKLSSASSSCRPHKWPGENIHRIKFSLSLSQKTQEMCLFKSICWLSSQASGVVLQKEKKTTLTKCLMGILQLVFYWSSFIAGPHSQLMVHLMANDAFQSCSRSAPITLSLFKGSFCTNAWINSSGPI